MRRAYSLLGIKSLISSILLGMRHPNIVQYASQFEIDDTPDSINRRISFDYINFRRANSLVNQLVLNLAFIIVLGIVPLGPLLVVWAFFQANEFSAYWMTGSAIQEIKRGEFSTTFWSRWKYLSNMLNFLFITVAFTVFALNVQVRSLMPTGACWLIVMILSSSLNFFSVKFNIISLVSQSIFIISIGFYFGDIFDLGLNFVRDGIFLLPVIMSIFAGHVGVWVYSRFYSQSLEKEQQFNRSRMQLVANSREMAKEKILMDLIQKTINEAIVVVGNDNVIVRANPAFSKIFGRSEVTLNQLLITDVLDPSVLVRDGVKRTIKLKNGKSLLVEGAALGFHDEHDLTLYIAIDITGRVKQEESVVQTQKLNALGTLSGGIAHDFNNYLAVILSNSELISQSDDIEEIKSRYLTDIVASAESAAGLTSQILSFARKVPLKAMQVDTEEIILETVKLVRNSVEPFHNIDVSVNSTLKVECDRVLLKNALLNLILNSRDAMPNGGRIGVSVNDAGKYVKFTVTDTGIGIAEDMIEKVTEPFFTMKPNEKGTGIGLAMVKQFSERSGGDFNIMSKLGEGTTAEIVLPAFESVNSTNDVEAVLNQELETVPLKILVVDDNKLLLKSLERQLILEGHLPKLAASLDEVTQLDHLSDIDVVLCDMVLNNESGIDVWKFFQAQNFEAKFIFISGNIAPNLMNELKVINATHIVEKPISIVKLKAAIQAAYKLS